MNLVNKLSIAVFSVIFAVLFFFGFKTEISQLNVANCIIIDKNQNVWSVECEVINSIEKVEVVKGMGITLGDAFEDLCAVSLKEMYLDAVQIYLVNDQLRNDYQIREYFINGNANMRAVAVYVNAEAIKRIKSVQGEESVTLPLVRKIQNYCVKTKRPVPEITELLKDEVCLSVSERGVIVRSDVGE